MIDLNTIPEENNLIDQGLEDQLTGIFGKMEEKVIIRVAVGLFRKKDGEIASFLRAVVSVSPNLGLELYGLGEVDQVSELNTAWLPVAGLYKGGAYGHATFHGMPGDRGIDPFMLVVYSLTGPGQEVPRGTRKKIERLDKEVNIKICVLLAHRHCPLVVTIYQQVTILNPDIEVEMANAVLCDDLVAQYGIKWAPMMIVNDNRIVVGNKTMDEIATLLK